MSDKSSIQWTDATWNFVRGCHRVSSGCDNCYAATMARRFDRPGYWGEGLTTIRKGRTDWSGEIRQLPDQLAVPLRWKRPRKIFVCSTSDLFHHKVPFEFADLAFEHMRAASHHTFQLLTKRPWRMREFFRRRPWGPLPNVWLGVSAERQKEADERIPLLLQCPAAVHWVSYEPALEAVDFRRWLPAVKWIVGGGESGPNARPCNTRWLALMIEHCRRAGVAPFVKQLGSRPRWGHWGGDEGTCAQARAAGGLADRNGGDMGEWPEALRVREFPV